MPRWTRVCLLMSTRGIGGADGLFRSLAHALVADRFELTIIGPAWDVYRHFLQLPSGVEYVPLPLAEPGTLIRGSPWDYAESEPPASFAARVALRVGPDAPIIRRAQMAVRLSRLRRARASLRAIVHDIGPQVLHVHNGGYPGAVAALAAVLASVDECVPRTILTLHSTPQARLLPFEARLDAAVSRAVHVATAVGSTAAAALVYERSFPAGKVSVIPPGIAPVRATERAEVRLALGLAPTALVVGMIANFVPGKDQALLLAAFAHVVDRLPNARLVLVGDGPMRPAAERAAAAHGVSDHVVFAGRRSAESVISAFDVLALASRREGVPITILEAMSIGLPVVASDVGAVRDAVEHGRTGFLVGVGNTAALASAITDLLSDSARARAFGEAGRSAFNSRFQAQAMASSFEQLYNGG